MRPAIKIYPVEKLTRSFDANRLYLKWDIFIVAIDSFSFRSIELVRFEYRAAFGEDEHGGGIVFNKTYYAFLRARRRVIENIANPLCVFA